MVGAGSGARVSVPGTSGELDRLAMTMNSLLGRIDAQAEVQGQFIADALHELKSPVANLRIVVETAAQHMSAEEWALLRSTLVGETERLQVLIDDLLFLSRSDESGIGAGIVHLDDVIFDEVERVSSRIGEIVLDASQVVLCDVEGDEGQLARVVRNLLDNAVAHARGRISIASAVKGVRCAWSSMMMALEFLKRIVSGCSRDSPDWRRRAAARAAEPVWVWPSWTGSFLHTGAQ
jgi:signal transduction histidine kinase